MAGSYPDAIGPRLPFDRDGSVGLMYNTSTGTVTQMTQAQLTGINDESTAGTIVSLTGSSNAWYAGFMFPVAIDFMGYFITYSGNHSSWGDGPIQTSNDTTNFYDGTWTQIAASHTTNSITNPNYRTGQIALSAPNIKAIRFRYTSGAGSVSSGWSAINIFGKPTATGDRLELWHPTLDQSLFTTPAYFDFGDVSRGTGAITKDFRVKNLSSSLTANSLTIGVEALTDSGAPTYVSQTQFRYNGGAYASTATLASLAPATISQPFTVQLTTTGSSVLGLWAQRYYAQAGSWS